MVNMGEADLVQVLLEGDSDLVGKEPAEVFAAQTEVVGNLFQRDWLVIILINV